MYLAPQYLVSRNVDVDSVSLDYRDNNFLVEQKTIQHTLH